MRHPPHAPARATQTIVTNMADAPAEAAETDEIPPSLYWSPQTRTRTRGGGGGGVQYVPMPRDPKELG